MTIIKHHQAKNGALPLRNRQDNDTARPLDASNALYEQITPLRHVGELLETETTIEDPVEELEAVNTGAVGDLAAGELPTPGRLPTSRARREWLDKVQDLAQKQAVEEVRPDKMVVFTVFPSHYEFMERVSGSFTD